ncbi:MAG: sensor domain-containing diguanylate cyclase [Planctomycetota bacterium]
MKATPEERLALQERDLADLRAQVSDLTSQNDQLRNNIEVLDGFRMQLAAFTEKLNLVTRLTHEVNTLDIEKISEVAIERIPLLVDAKYASLFFHNSATGELTLKRHNHPTEINRKVIIRHCQNTVMGLAIREKRLIVIRDFDRYESTNGVKFERTFADKYASKSCICAPLLAGDQLVGVLNLADKNTPGEGFEELNDLPPIEQLSSILGAAIQNWRLFQEIQAQARTDSMTKLNNYRAFQEQLKAEVHRATRYQRRLTLLMIDVDHFKEINDAFGHQGGDHVLEQVAGAIRSYIRREDFAARYGGDEMAVILPETGLAGASIVAQRLGDLVRDHKFELSDPDFKVGLSIGVAELAEGMTPADFIRKADDGLYKAKKGGRGRVETGGTE